MTCDAFHRRWLYLYSFESSSLCLVYFLAGLLKS